MLLISLLAPAWLALGHVGGAPLGPAQPQGAAHVSVALHQGAQGLNFDLFHPELPQKVDDYIYVGLK